MFEHATDSLGAIVAEEQGESADELEAWVVANSLLGVHRALVGYVRRQVLAGQRGPALRAEAWTHAERALVALEHGLESYGAR